MPRRRPTKTACVGAARTCVVAQPVVVRRPGTTSRIHRSPSGMLARDVDSSLPPRAARARNGRRPLAPVAALAGLIALAFVLYRPTADAPFEAQDFDVFRPLMED